MSKARREGMPVAVSQEPWAVALRKKYGDFMQFADRFCPENQEACERSVKWAIDRREPDFGGVVAAYGRDAMIALMTAHVTEAILWMGEDQALDSRDIRSIAELLVTRPASRSLSYMSVFAFFLKLKSGEYTVYGNLTPRKFMEVFQRYAVDQTLEEERHYRDRDRREREEERRRWAEGAVTWEQYAASRGIEDPSAASFFSKLFTPAAKGARDTSPNGLHTAGASAP